MPEALENTCIQDAVNVVHYLVTHIGQVNPSKGHGVVYLLYMLYCKLSCMYCFSLSCVYFCSCFVCIVVFVLCLLL